MINLAAGAEARQDTEEAPGGTIFTTDAQKSIRQLNADQSIVSKDIVDQKELSLHKQLKQRAAENNSATPASTAALQVFSELRLRVFPGCTRLC
jgi:hypothetical protein